MRTCFVPFCDVRNKDQSNRTMFLVPREQTVFARWVEALPKIRTLRFTDRVCHLHFRPGDVVYTFDHCIKGQIYKIKRDRPRLKPDAIPCLDMTTAEELLSHSIKPHLSNKPKISIISNNVLPEQIRDSITASADPKIEEKNINSEIQDETADNCTIIVNLANENQIVDLFLEESNHERGEDPETTYDSNGDHLAMTQQICLFNLLYDNVYKILTPNTLWGIHRSPDRSLICFSYMETSKMQVTKMVHIKADGSVQLIFNGRVFRTLQLLYDIEDVNSLSILLKKVDMWRLCFGAANTNCEIIVDPNDNDKCWSSIADNEQLFFCKLCMQPN